MCNSISMLKPQWYFRNFWLVVIFVCWAVFSSVSIVQAQECAGRSGFCAPVDVCDGVTVDDPICTGSTRCCIVGGTSSGNACTDGGGRCARVDDGCNTTTEQSSSRGGCSTGQMCCDPKSSTGTTPSTGTGSTTPPVVTYSPVLLQNPLKFNNIPDLLTTLLSSLLGLIVTLALIMLVIGAFLYITSAGDEGRIETAKKTILAALIGLALGIAAPAFLREIGSILGWTSSNLPTGVGTSLTLMEIASNVLTFLLTIIGILAIIMLIIGGIMYLTAAGDEDRIDQGKKIVKYALIGITVALAALVLVKQVAGFFS